MRKLYRSRRDRKIAGICGGIAEYFEMDSTLVRLTAIFLCFVTGIAPLVLIYIIGWFIIPERS